MQSAELLSSLGNPVRLQIVETLSEAGALCVNDVTARLGGMQSNISHHLRILLNAGAVEMDKVQTKRVYKVKDKVVKLVSMAKEVAGS